MPQRQNRFSILCLKEFLLKVKDKIKIFFQHLRIRLIFLHRKHPALLYFWCFTIPALIMTFLHACIGVYPFGKMSVLTLDLNAQYVFFFEALRDWVWGEGSILYSFSRSLGGEFLGIYAYYLASPLSYIVALFPKANITEALYCMFVIKCGLCGLTFSIFLRRKDHTSPAWTLLFSAMYALIGYATIMQHNTMWIDNMILLPLIVLGLYELICHRKYKLYTISLALAILSNFYIGYMTCIFVALYSVFLYLSLSPEKRNPKRERLHLPRAIARVGVFSLIAVAISALMILPAYYALTFGKTDFTNPNFVFKNRFPLLDLLKQFLFASYDTVRPDAYETIGIYEGMPIVYCGVLTLLLVPFYFICPRIRIRERLSYGIFVLLLFFTFSINTVDMIWHGFQMPNWLNYRYSFMLCFVLIYMASRGMRHFAYASKKSVLIITAGWLFVVALVSFYRYKKVTGVFTLLGTVLFVVIYTALLLKWYKYPTLGRKTKRLMKTAIVGLVCVELTLNGIFNLAMLWDDVGMSDRFSYAFYNYEWQPTFDAVKAQDKDFYRMEKLPYRRMNDPSAFGFRGVTASTSTLHAETIAFLEYMGISADSHWSEYCGSSPVTDSVLGIRYVVEFNFRHRVSDTYELYITDGAHDVYYNPNALPIAFCVSEDINSISFKPEKDPETPDGRTHLNKEFSVFSRMNFLVTAMMGEDELIHVYVPYDDVKMVKGKNISSLNYYQNHVLYKQTQFVEGGEAPTITFTLDGSDGKEIFAYFPSEHMRDGTSVTIGNGETLPWFNNSNFGTLYVGKIPNGTKRDVTIHVGGKDGVFIVTQGNVSAIDRENPTDYNYDSYFYTLNEATYSEVFEELKAGGIVLDHFTEDSFHGTITAPADRTTVMTTLPYDEGWNIKVDGKPVEIYKTLDALVAFDITEGTHQIEMTYMPEIYGTALRISIAGVSTLALIMACEFVYCLWRKKRAQNH
ncbi:MAG: YfhO family protein [Clostridia bacterium]|nr:YfhO family protein [Clostridia bacterium]